jgi:Tfp pilus assembly PilM family ATPase
VRAELERLVTGIAQPIETRHWSVPSGSGGAPAIGIGVARQLPTQAAEACAKAGLRCQRVAPTAVAVGDFLRLLREWKPNELWGALDVGVRQSRLILCVEGLPVLIRQAGTGSGYWTARIAESLSVSIRAAEIHKRDCGIPAGGTQNPESSRGELSSLVLGAIRRELLDLATEVKRSYEYVMRLFPGKIPADLVLIGGGSLLRNLPSFLSDALGISVIHASSYLGASGCRLSYAEDRRQPLPVLAGAIGLCGGDVNW